MSTLRCILLVLALQLGLVFQPAKAAAGESALSRPVLIRDATLHTMSAAGTLEHTDLLIKDGKIAEIGHGLNAPTGAEVIEAGGRPVTPGLFGGLGHLGIEEIGIEPTVD